MGRGESPIARDQAAENQVLRGDVHFGRSLNGLTTLKQSIAVPAAICKQCPARPSEGRGRQESALDHSRWQ